MRLFIYIFILIPIAAMGNECHPKIPDSLIKYFKSEWNKYNGLNHYNYPRNVLEKEKKFQPKNGCINVKAIVFGGKITYGFLASRKDTDEVSGFLANQQRGKWRIKNIWTSRSSDPFCCYVNIANPGLYKRSENLDAPEESNDFNYYRSKHEGFVFGVIESSATVFFYHKSHIIKVMISD